MAAEHHPNAPAAVGEAVATLVARGRRCVMEALADVEPATPAFSLCLFPSDDPDYLAPEDMALGLESDRMRALEKPPEEAEDDIWNPTRYSYISLPDFGDPAGEPDFDTAAATVRSWLRDVPLGDPARWVLEETAAALTHEPPLQPVTDDFICWAWAQGRELTASLAWMRSRL